MEFFVQRAGKRLGPMMSFQLREKLDDGEIAPTDLGWHEGMEAWRPLHEIEALEILWQKKEQPEPATEASATPAPPPLPQWTGVPHPELAQMQLISQRTGQAWLRWLARLADTMLYIALTMVVCIGFGLADFWTFLQPRTWQMMAATVAGALLLEGLCICFFTCTPGKALLGIRVVRESGGRLSLSQSLMRSLEVLVFGAGAYIFPLNIVTWILGFLRLRRLGATMWDQRQGLQVTHRPPGAAGIVGVVLVFIVTFAGLWHQWMHAPLSDSMDPEFRKQVEQIRALNAPLAPATRPPAEAPADDKSNQPEPEKTEKEKPADEPPAPPPSSSANSTGGAGAIC